MTYQRPDDERCKDCRAFDSGTGVPGNGVGYCRLGAPKKGRTWSRVGDRDWCLDFEPIRKPKGGDDIDCCDCHKPLQVHRVVFQERFDIEMYRCGECHRGQPDEASEGVL